MLRSLLAVLAGFGVMAIMMVVFSWMASALTGVPTDDQTTGFALITVGIVLISSLAGGMLTGNLAPVKPLMHGIGLAVFFMLWLIPMLVFGPRLGQPEWYPYVMLLAGAGGAVLGSIIVPRSQEPVRRV
jgi:hypothetical protein